jgi:RNA polymerase sigma-70 factor (ECF subfamily)
MQERQTYIPAAATAVQMRRQSSDEFEDVVSRSLSALYRRAYRFVGDPQDAEDAVQDALLSAYKHLDQFKGTAKMTTWLTSIVTNSALTQLRRRPRRPHVSLDERFDEEQDYSWSDRLADPKPSPEVECMNSELYGHLLQCVAELAPSSRKVIQLRHLDGLTTDETAQILGLADGTVKSHVSRARTKLKRLIREM